MAKSPNRPGAGGVWLPFDEPPAGEPPATRFDAQGHLVMAGGIDLHSHIGGGKVNLARLLLPELQREGLNPRRCGPHEDEACSLVTPGTLATGLRYAQMGYTAAFEPAMLPANARHAHQIGRAHV